MLSTLQDLRGRDHHSISFGDWHLAFPHLFGPRVYCIPVDNGLLLHHSVLIEILPVLALPLGQGERSVHLEGASLEAASFLVVAAVIEPR